MGYYIGTRVFIRLDGGVTGARKFLAPVAGAIQSGSWRSLITRDHISWPRLSM